MALASVGHGVFLPHECGKRAQTRWTRLPGMNQPRCHFWRWSRILPAALAGTWGAVRARCHGPRGLVKTGYLEGRGLIAQEVRTYL